ncbi:MAG: VOC family protein [Verrucomicrobiota bacterium]|jgi:PhnB protein
MSTKQNSPVVHAHLSFEGRCEEAIDFYRQALGAEVIMLMRFKENPDPPAPGCQPPASENKVMHARIRIGDTVLMVSDGRCAGKPSFQGFTISLTVPSESEVDRLCNALANGGQVQMPPAKTFFSPRFGMVADRFGLVWMLLVTPTELRR